MARYAISMGTHDWRANYFVTVSWPGINFTLCGSCKIEFTLRQIVAVDRANASGATTNFRQMKTVLTFFFLIEFRCRFCGGGRCAKKWILTFEACSMRMVYYLERDESKGRLDYVKVI